MANRASLTFPTPFTVTVRRRTQDGTDGFGEPIWQTEDVSVPCSGWAEPEPAEQIRDQSSGRLVFDINAYVKAGKVVEHETVLVDGTEYTCIGVGNFDHGPWAECGLDVLKLKRVTG